MNRLLVVDEHPVVRDGLRCMLSHTGEFEVKADAGSGSDAVNILRDKADEVDLVLFDIHLPEGDGLDALKRIVREWPSLPVLVFTRLPESEYATRVMRAGARGYLRKHVSSEELVSALRSIAQGESVAPPDALEVPAVAGRKGPVSHADLSDREFEVLRLLAAGTTQVAIAKRLGVSVKTINTYRARILRKLNFTSNAHAIAYAVRSGLLSEPVAETAAAGVEH